MRIFLTGGTGYIGAAVLDALVRAGHHVDALVRNTHKAARVEERGAHPVRGDLASPDTYTSSAAAADVIVHAAFEYTARGATVDATAVDALLTAARASASVRAFIYTSGVWVLGNTPTPADECAGQLVVWRSRSFDHAVLTYSQRGNGRDVTKTIRSFSVGPHRMPLRNP